MQYVDVHLIARWQSLIEEKYLDYIKKKTSSNRLRALIEAKKKKNKVRVDEKESCIIINTIVDQWTVWEYVFVIALRLLSLSLNCCRKKKKMTITITPN